MNINKFLKKGKKKLHCTQDQTTGDVSCKSVRELEDGSQIPLAEADFSFDAQCNATPSNIVEHEEGELDKLVKKSMHILGNKCKNRPEDY